MALSKVYFLKHLKYYETKYKVNNSSRPGNNKHAGLRQKTGGVG